MPATPQLAWLFIIDAADLDERELFLLEYLFQDDQLKVMYNRAHNFKSMLLQEKADDFDTWLNEAQNSHITILQTFAQGLKLDYDAVKAAMTSIWSNGRVEGQVNKLKGKCTVVRVLTSSENGFFLLNQYNSLENQGSGLSPLYQSVTSKG